MRPVLAENCHECHGAKRQKNGLRLDSREAVLRGSDFNKVVVAGDPENSLLIKAVRHAAGRGADAVRRSRNWLPNQIEALAQWIKMGLPWPNEVVAGENKAEVAAALGVSAGEETGGSGDHKSQVTEWSERSRRRPEGEVGGRSNPNPIDAFVAAKLQRRRTRVRAAGRRGHTLPETVFRSHRTAAHLRGDAGLCE